MQGAYLTLGYGLSLGGQYSQVKKSCCLDCPLEAKFGIGGTKIGAVTMEQLKRIWEQTTGHKMPEN
jgi:hypothetical protein